MTYEQYWHEDVLMVRAFRKADELRQERMNETAWLHGMYVYNAFAVALANSFRKKGSKPDEYPERPYPITETERKRNAELEQEQERQRLVNYINRLIASDKLEDKRDE